MQQILVLGVGNILYSDEGLGVRTVEHLERHYTFSPNVSLMDGGTLGMRLMDAMMQCDVLLVVDAVHHTGIPGDIYRLTGDNLRKSIAFADSLHQTDLVDTLVLCEIAGKRPDAIIWGMEPEDYTTQGLCFTATVARQLPALCAAILRDVEQLGGTWAHRTIS